MTPLNLRTLQINREISNEILLQAHIRTHAHKYRVHHKKYSKTVDERTRTSDMNLLNVAKEKGAKRNE